MSLHDPFIHRAETIEELLHLRRVEERRLMGIRWDDQRFRRETEARICICERRILNLFSPKTTKGA